ncbi:MAG: hypothetical protein JXR34_12640 [Bacteroidales bacterium]|nr:hypothetical protein [Bacteroidales bacterium]
MVKEKVQEYKDYKIAAQRHLRTCEYLETCLLLPENSLHKPPKEHYKRDLLKNIYYLAGYVAECSINYAIYETINENLGSDSKMVYVEDLNIHGPPYRLLFQTPVPKDCPKQFYYIIGTHKFQKNIDILRELASAKIEDIPLIGKPPKNWGEIKKLYDDWNPSARYRNNLMEDYTESQILSFSNFVKELYVKIRQCITN